MMLPRAVMHVVMATTLGAVAVASHVPARAETFRWAFQGEAETMDPYGRFEIFTLGSLHNIYEPLVRYDSAECVG